MMMGGVALALLVGAFAAMPGCGGGKAAEDPAGAGVDSAVPAAREACRSASIVICCIDAARADHVGCYGYHRDTTPKIDELAAQGVRFDLAVTDAPYTRAAVASLWTGLSPDTHGCAVVGTRIPLELTTLPEACEAAGMRTAVVSSSGLIVRPHGFADGVQDFISVHTSDPYQDRVPELRQAWCKWLDGVGGDRFFMYVHIMPPHVPYELSGQFQGRFDPDYNGSLGRTWQLVDDLDNRRVEISERHRHHLIAMYDEALSYADWAVGRLVRDLQDRRLLDKTVLIVFSDHGEAFGEHGRWGHSHTVYEEMTRIPLIARFPAGVAPARPTVAGLAQLSDLAPTLASLCGLGTLGRQAQGRDLTPEIFGGPETRQAAISRSAPGPDERWSVRLPDAKGIFDREGALRELYDLDADPGEQKNLVGTEVALEGPVTDAWKTWDRQQKEQRQRQEAAPVGAPDLDQKTKKWLRSLGYL